MSVRRRGLVARYRPERSAAVGSRARACTGGESPQMFMPLLTESWYWEMRREQLEPFSSRGALATRAAGGKVSSWMCCSAMMNGWS